MRAASSDRRTAVPRAVESFRGGRSEATSGQPAVSPTRPVCLLPPLALALAVICGTMQAAEKVSPATAEQLDFFERRIRPVLVERCYPCHSSQADILQGGLLLDSAAGALKGGDSGPAVVPGKPDESLLIQALRYESFEMPPDGKLPAAVVADFVHWMETGAADPRHTEAEMQAKGAEMQATRAAPGSGRHWAFRGPSCQPSRPLRIPHGRVLISIVSSWHDSNKRAWRRRLPPIPIRCCAGCTTT